MKFPEGENITWLSSHLMARLFLMVIKRTWGIFFLCVTNLMLAFLSSLNHFVLFISNSSPVIRWGDLLNVSGDWGSNHVPFNVTWKLVPMMLYYFSSDQLAKLLRDFHYSSSMEIDEGWRLAIHWMDAALFTLLGHGTSSLFPSLFPRSYFQLDANR